VLEPRTHLLPRGGAHASRGHFNVLRGAVPEYAGVKVFGDFVGNHVLGLPSELACCSCSTRTRGCHGR
jgi:alanine dehydrogenase